MITENPTSAEAMAGKRVSRYMLYAIGEIALVMIGILLALQVNNWNEARKHQETLKAIYRITKADLKNDIAEIDAFINEYDEIRKPAFEAVLKTELTREDWLKNTQYASVLRGYKDFSINLRGFELLKSQSDISAEKSLDSEIILFYNRHNIEIEVGQKEIMEEFSLNVKKLKDYDWFSSFYIQNEMDGVIDYMINDPTAKNDVALYYVLFNIYVEELRKFKISGEELIAKIDQYTAED